MPRFVTRHRLCDLAFCFLLQKDKSTVRFQPDDDDFVYFYSRGRGGDAASGACWRELGCGHVSRREVRGRRVRVRGGARHGGRRELHWGRCAPA